MKMCFLNNKADIYCATVKYTNRLVQPLSHLKKICKEDKIDRVTASLLSLVESTEGKRVE